MPKKPTSLAGAQARAIAGDSSRSMVEGSARQAGSKGPSRIMYIESKAGELTGEARIGRVTFSRTWITIYYKDQVFQRLPQCGFKSNYCDIATRSDYWISGPKKDGTDRLYSERVPIYIDDDVREEYWCEVRNQPERKHETTA